MQSCKSRISEIEAELHEKKLTKAEEEHNPDENTGNEKIKEKKDERKKERKFSAKTNQERGKKGHLFSPSLD